MGRIVQIKKNGKIKKAEGAAIKTSSFLQRDQSLSRLGITGFLRVAARITAAWFDAAFSSGESFVMPYGFFIGWHYTVDDAGRMYQSPVCMHSIWKLSFVVMVGISSAIPTFFKCLVMSRKINTDRV